MRALTWQGKRDVRVETVPTRQSRSRRTRSCGSPPPRSAGRTCTSTRSSRRTSPVGKKKKKKKKEKKEKEKGRGGKKNMSPVRTCPATHPTLSSTTLSRCGRPSLAPGSPRRHLRCWPRHGTQGPAGSLHRFCQPPDVGKRPYSPARQHSPLAKQSGRERVLTRTLVGLIALASSSGVPQSTNPPPRPINPIRTATVRDLITSRRGGGRRTACPDRRLGPGRHRARSCAPWWPASATSSVSAPPAVPVARDVRAGAPLESLTP